MRPTERVLREGKGSVFVPKIDRYSLLISGIPKEEFDRVQGRALSIYRAFKSINCDGVFVKADVVLSFVGSGQLGKHAVDEEDLYKHGMVKATVEVIKRLSAMVGPGHEVLCILHGPRLLEREMNVSVHDLIASIDNLSLLERLYLEAGCTAILLIEDVTSYEELENLGVLTRVSKHYDSHILIKSKRVLEREAFETAHRAGFDFIGPASDRRHKDVGLLVSLDLTDRSLSEAISQIRELMCEVPIFVTTESEVAETTRLQDLKKVVEALKK
ncbi:MAG: hypothetical protein NZ920_00070 [Aigarchaeota archaeon]|nr:hypothetical protein [Aigarchaeota archaeon]MDW8092794.1 hypothetical protein [Nitrososphaerota archaeon]